MKGVKILFCPLAILLMLCLGVTTSAIAAFTWSGTAAAPANDYGYARNTGAYFDPNGLGTTITGTLDLSTMTQGATIMFGLIDKKNYDGGVSSGFMGGAYAYFSRSSDTVLRIGPTDGNANPLGAIVSGTSGTYQQAVYQNSMDFVLYIHNGIIDLSSPSSAFPTQSWTYGLIKKLNNQNPYSWNEFQYGAYLGYDFAADGGAAALSGASVGFNVSAAPAVVPIPAAVWLLGSGLLGLIGIRRRFKN
jgi:hypothetical protein